MAINRVFDCHEGGRNCSLTVRLTEKEEAYVRAEAKKLNISRGAFIMSHIKVKGEVESGKKRRG